MASMRAPVPTPGSRFGQRRTMAIADIRQRPGVLLGAAILLHVVLISAQVNTASGLPMLQVVTFGSFSEVQRGTMATVDGVRDLWSGYIALRQVQHRKRRAQARTRRPCRSGCRRSAPRRSAPTTCASCSNCASAPTSIPRRRK